MMKGTCGGTAAVVIAGMVVCGAGGRAMGEPVAVVNHSFEANVIPVNTFAALIPQGWQGYDPSGIIDQGIDALGVIRPTNISFFPTGATHGEHAALVFLAGDIGGGEAGLAQTVAATLGANVRYTLRVDVGNIASGTSVPPNFVQFFNLNGFPGYRVDLLAGGVVIAQDNNTLAGSIPEGEWRESVVRFTAPAGHPRLGTPLRIRLVNLNQQGTAQAPGIEVDFDNVRLDASPVPACATDFNGDGFVEPGDLDEFITAFFAGPPENGAADFNGDGLVEPGDLDEFITAYFEGCGG
ncbi:MAG: GC-type dockerin domain-anchored protein [Phycisphaerales bacterium]